MFASCIAGCTWRGWDGTVVGDARVGPGARPGSGPGLGRDTARVGVQAPPQHPVISAKGVVAQVPFPASSAPV